MALSTNAEAAVFVYAMSLNKINGSIDSGVLYRWDTTLFCVNVTSGWIQLNYTLATVGKLL